MGSLVDGPGSPEDVLEEIELIAEMLDDSMKSMMGIGEYLAQVAETQILVDGGVSDEVGAATGWVVEFGIFVVHSQSALSKLQSVASVMNEKWG